ncbi:MAG: hypothetical protein PHS57_06195 [Alphaproteobacteria bacterium]|nr:hypothetical protein [Alphaproteobacteria bacterium]
MSYTEIYGFNSRGECEWMAEIRNAWRGAMAVWQDLEKRYLTPVRYGTRLLSFRNDTSKEVWELFYDPRLSETERIVMGTTLDNVLVRASDATRILEAFRAYPGETNLKKQADAIEQLCADGDCTAIGWNQTSVSGDTWANAGGFDEEKDESIPYNFLTMDKHWWLFDEEGRLPEKEDEE